MNDPRPLCVDPNVRCAKCGGFGFIHTRVSPAVVPSAVNQDHKPFCKLTIKCDQCGGTGRRNASD